MIKIICNECLDCSPEEWNQFAGRCETSYRGLYGGLKLWLTRNGIVLYKARRFALLRFENGTLIKIGQCAIGIGSNGVSITDGVQLLKEHESAWLDCLWAILRKCKPGIFMYGSDWSLEPCRASKIAGLPGVKVNAVDNFVVEAVDFKRWDSWEQYERQISSNIRRNLSSSRRKYPSASTKTKYGKLAFLLSFFLLQCKLSMHRRKGFSINLPEMIGSHVARLLLIPEYTFCSVIFNGKRPLAAFGGVEFGGKAYYLEGGSTQGDGSGWLLKIDIMKDFFQRHPFGYFVMGSSRSEKILSQDWVSTDRYRRDCRVSPFHTSIVTFSKSAFMD